MALQGPGPDPSERIFGDLRSKNEEVKSKAAAELRDLITLLSRGQINFLGTHNVLTLAKNGPPSASASSTTKSPTASATSLSRLPRPATKWEESSLWIVS